MWLFPAKAFAQDAGLDRLGRIIDVLPDEKLIHTLQTTMLEPHEHDPHAEPQVRPKSRRGNTKTYSPRSCWYVLLTAIVFRHKYITDALAELHRNSDLRELTGMHLPSRVPSKWVMTRFLALLVAHADIVDEMFDELVRELKTFLPHLGQRLGVDSSKMHTHARGKADPAESADATAGWGVKTHKRTRPDGSTYESVSKWFGYKLHMLIDTVYELPLAYTVTPANVPDNQEVVELLDQAARNLEQAQAQAQAQAHLSHSLMEHTHGPQDPGAQHATPEPTPAEPARELKPGDARVRVTTVFEDAVLSADKAYDDEAGIYTVLYHSYGIRVVIPLRESMDEHEGKSVYDRDRLDQVRHPETREWHDLKFLGFEKDRATLKYGCPCEANKPCPFYGAKCDKSRGGRGAIFRIHLSENRRYYTPVARGTKKWQREYNRRSACERVFARLKDVMNIEDTGWRGLARARLRGALGALMLVAHAVACLREGRADPIRSLKTA
jgi:hypothetical protein